MPDVSIVLTSNIVEQGSRIKSYVITTISGNKTTSTTSETTRTHLAPHLIRTRGAAEQRHVRALLKEVFEGLLGRFYAFLGQPLELGEVTGGDRSCGEVFAGKLAAFIQQLVQFAHVVAGVSEVREPVESILVAGVGELPQ
jgi:hypothetical protein